MKPVTGRSIWGVRALASPNFLQLRTYAKPVGACQYFETVSFQAPLLPRWVFYETPEEALLGFKRYWATFGFKPLRSPWRFYLFRWEDDGAFMHIWNMDKSYDDEALHGGERILPPPANVYEMPGYLQHPSGILRPMLRILNDIFTSPVPVARDPDPAMQHALTSNASQMQAWFERITSHLHARCPTPNPDPEPMPSTSGVNHTQRCTQFIAQTIENDMPWVQNWIQEMADAAGLPCPPENASSDPCPKESCDAAVAQVITGNPDFVQNWILDMAASFDLSCPTSAAHPDPHCIIAIDHAIFNQDTWIREMIKLLLHYSGHKTCSDDSELANDVLQFLQDDFELSREQLIIVLAQGPQWLRQNFPQLLAVLFEFTQASIGPLNCFQKPRFGKRTLQHRDTAQQDMLCRELLSDILDERKKAPGVYSCKKESLNQPCFFIEAKADECVVLTEALDKNTYWVRPEKTAGHCTLFSGHDCSDSGITTQFPGMALGNEVVSMFNNEIGSIRCDGIKTALEHKIRGCTSFDDLTVYLKLGSGFGTGTWSKIYYLIGGSKTLFLAAHGPHGGSCIETKIDMIKAFGSATVPASYISTFTIWDVLNNDGIFSNPAALGGDKWLLESFRIDAHCASASKTLVYQVSINEMVSHDSHQINMPTPVKSVFIKPQDWTVASEYLPETCQIGFADSEKHPTHECTEFSQLQLHVQLGSGYYQGTWDTLYLYFQRNERHVIASGPSPGFQKYMELDVPQVFKAPKVAFSHLGLVEIYQYHDSILGNDDWKLHGIKLKARCANSLTEYQLDKYASVNYGVGDMNAPWHTSWRAWSASIDPQKDWNQVFECSKLFQLSARINLCNKLSSGTSDDLFIRFETGNKKEFIFATRPSRGTAHSVMIYMSQAFRTPDVSVGELKAFSILSRAHKNNTPDQWCLGTVILHATCAGSEKKLVHDTFNVYGWYERGRNFKAEINLKGWHLADANGNRAGAPGDF
ncbi:hypothetical protein CDD82_3894 [Ophiocordyceps australis]|uniref:Uncharacterized protein n=1 Tax=Ophiocordyceps australis TaxID=1399860 RepID=A0A2C5Z6N9_9HYPO|nr:hypothetical protein CDD82_3894 [Ophiocordyceps australis]